MSTSPEKKQLVTHSGAFHADDVFAAATLQLCFTQRGVETTLVRSRDHGTVNNGDVVFDVGGTYNPAAGRFDHHQPDGAGKRENGIPYAAFGLIWKHYGHLLVSEEIHRRIDQKLVQPIDANDTGVSIVRSRIEGIEPFTIHDTIHTLFMEEDTDRGFTRAVTFAQEVLSALITKEQMALRNREKILDAYHCTPEVSVLVLDFHVPRQDIWEALLPYDTVSFVVFPDRDGISWRGLAMRTDLTSFNYRVLFPAAWGGLTGRKLQDASGVADADFCHNSGFLVGAASREGAQLLAQKALT